MLRMTVTVQSYDHQDIKYYKPKNPVIVRIKYYSQGVLLPFSS
jgi:hypothetical protein